MIIRSSKIRIVLAFMALFLIQFAILSPVSADLTEVETNKQGLSKTEPTDASGGEPVDGKDGPLPWWKKALNELGDFGDSLIDGWNKFKDWAVDEWNDAWDFAEDKWNDAWDIATDVWGNIEDFFESIGDWFSENEWAQTLLGGILAAGIIIGVIALLVFFGVIAIPLGIVAGLIIVAGALIGGFTYQWLAGDNYSFWGAFSFSLVGGVLGYIGYATGAFAAAIGWLRTVAWPAAANWWRTAAWPWLRGRPAAIWGWMKGPAWNWLKGRGLMLKGWFTGRAVPWAQGLWSKIVTYYTTGSLWNRLFYGPVLGMIGGATSNLVGVRITGKFELDNLLIDMAIGGFTGGLLGPIVASMMTYGRLSWKAVFGLSIYGGAENYLADGFKEGAWTSFDNFFFGMGMSVISIKVIGLLVDKYIKVEPIAEMTKKTVEELFKSGVKGELFGNEEPKSHVEKQTDLQPKELPDKSIKTETVKEPGNDRLLDSKEEITNEKPSSNESIQKELEDSQKTDNKSFHHSDKKLHPKFN